MIERIKPVNNLSSSDVVTPPVLTISQLYKAGVQFGRQTSKWNPKMWPYILTAWNELYLIDLVKTSRQITAAYYCVREATANKETILFIGTKPQASDILKEQAQRCGVFYVNNRWLGGTLTNWETTRKRVECLQQLETSEQNGKLDLLPKKEASRLRRKREKLRHKLDGLKGMKKLPNVVVIVDPDFEKIAVKECSKLKIPIISIMDTNCDPSLITLPIPANVDGKNSIQLILSKIADGIVPRKGYYSGTVQLRTKRPDLTQTRRKDL